MVFPLQRRVLVCARKFFGGVKPENGAGTDARLIGFVFLLGVGEQDTLFKLGSAVVSVLNA